MVEDTPKLTGQCLCGDIRFRVDGPVQHTTTCHCQQCRQWAGHAWPSANVSQDDLIITNGEQSIAWHESSEHAERGFCLLCGASLFWRRLDNPENRVAVGLGCLDAPTGLTMGEDIFKEDKGDYYSLPEN